MLLCLAPAAAFAQGADASTAAMGQPVDITAAPAAAPTQPAAAPAMPADTSAPQTPDATAANMDTWSSCKSKEGNVSALFDHCMSDAYDSTKAQLDKLQDDQIRAAHANPDWKEGKRQAQTVSVTVMSFNAYVNSECQREKDASTTEKQPADVMTDCQIRMMRERIASLMGTAPAPDMTAPQPPQMHQVNADGPATTAMPVEPVQASAAPAPGPVMADAAPASGPDPMGAAPMDSASMTAPVPAMPDNAATTVETGNGDHP